MHIVEHGAHGIGIKIKKGDKFVFPKGWIQLSLNPLKSSGHFTQYGLEQFVRQLFFDQFPQNKGQIEDEITKIEACCDQILQGSEFIRDLDIHNPDHSEEIVRRLKENSSSPEWWALLVEIYAGVVKQALEDGDAQEVAWAMAGLERSRSVLIYKQNLEEVVWMGHSAKRVVDILGTWDANKNNGDEAFWQIKLTENAYVVSQVFAVPVVFIKDNAYVGGMNIDRKNAKLVDYLYLVESSRETILVEIKTPVTKLLGSKYRGIYRPSQELSGALVQVLDYRRELVKTVGGLTQHTDYDLDSFNPRCVIIVGNGQAELLDDTRRKSFELFRSSQKDVEIVTYDELFRKVEILARLFSLVRAGNAGAAEVS